jgi:hypothetical protein
MHRLTATVSLLLLSACAEPASTGDSSLRVTFRTPAEFCQGTGRSIAVDRYGMKSRGAPLKEALELNNGVPVIDAITRAVYAGGVASEAQAAAAGTRACLSHFRGR